MSKSRPQRTVPIRDIYKMFGVTLLDLWKIERYYDAIQSSEAPIGIEHTSKKRRVLVWGIKPTQLPYWSSL